jgi:predicted ATPase
VSADTPLRLFVIGTFRDSDVATDHPLADALASLHREAGVERLALRGLRDDELLTLLEATIRHATAEEGIALRDALSVETDRNPFFVGEMLRHLTETSAIVQDEHGRWLASSNLQTSGLPVSIREVIGRRVARLGAPTQTVLSLAAVIGRDFDVDVLAPVAELDQDTLIELCDHAVAAAVLTEADAPGRYTFAHALIEHALYDHLSPGRRGRTHRSVAETLEELCGDDPAERIGELAYHWAHATQPPDAGKAIMYAQRAGDRALAHIGMRMRSNCSTGLPPPIRAVGPSCSSALATRNDRPGIPSTARLCLPRAASPTTSTRSASSCARRCGTTEAGTASWAVSTTSASTC